LKSIAVIGVGFGDEGKGRVVDSLCSQYPDPLVVRFSGGHQAGHHVVTEKYDHVFSNFGSGTLQGAPTYWSNFCTVDPVGLMKELDLLMKNGVSPRLFINAKCPITTPYDKLFNKSSEKINNHGSCGVGFGATIQREEDYHSLLFEDLYYPSVLNIKTDLIRKYYFQNLFYTPTTTHLKTFIKSCSQIINSNHVKITTDLTAFNNDLSKYEILILEGSQGSLLDQDIGFFPHVTRSNTGSKNIMSFNPKVVLVTRAYQTRHGAGPMTNENIPHNIKINPHEKNNDRGAQGKFRRSILDIDLLRYAINKDPYIRDSKDKTLVVTCLDLIEGEYKFTENGEVLEFRNEDDFISGLSNRLLINNIIRSNSATSPLEGFNF